MAFSKAFRLSIEKALQAVFGNQLTYQSFEPLSGGGCINNAGFLRTNAGAFFVKFNQHAYPGMFEAEAKGLALLAEADALHVPEVYASGSSDDGQDFLILEWIGTGKPVSDFWEHLGHGLAMIHGQQQNQYGLDFDNYIGSLPQYNHWTDSWSTFFCNSRLEPQVQLGLSTGTLPLKLAERIRGLFSRIPEWLPAAPPSLLHGDLWSGNLLVDETGKPAIIDPAVYYGHHEMELAFTSLFGGFNQRFYEAYQTVMPVEPGLEERKDLYNLYPLLVHVNLFGGGFVRQVESIVDYLEKKSY